MKNKASIITFLFVFVLILFIVNLAVLLSVYVTDNMDLTDKDPAPVIAEKSTELSVLTFSEDVNADDTVPAEATGYQAEIRCIIPITKEDLNVLYDDNQEIKDLILESGEKGVNIDSDDCSFYIEVDDHGLIEDIFPGDKDGYLIVTIDGDLESFIDDANDAVTIGDFWDLMKKVHMPFKFYAMLPKAVTCV